MDLKKIREEIDVRDSQIVKLLNERMELALLSKRFKVAVEDTGREKEVFDNSLDAERYIKIESGASMISSLALYDAPSAGGLTTLLNAKKCPFWEWDFPNLQTYTKIEAGSVVSATALLVGPNNTPIEKQVTLFSANS